MQIDWIEFENHDTGLKIKHVDFKKITLLVGKSGAGKSQILKILVEYLSSVVQECPFTFNGKFKLWFHSDNYGYLWEISTTDAKSLSNFNMREHPIESETLTKFLPADEPQTVFYRTYSDTKIQGFENLPRISETISLISIYRETEPMKKIIEWFSGGWLISFQGIVRTFIQDGYGFPSFEYTKMCSSGKLQAFMDDLKNIFPEIRNISSKPLRDDPQKRSLILWQNGRPIPQKEISSGMLKTIAILWVLHFSAYKGILLIDELEDGLGVNCMDEIVQCIRTHAAEEDIQFILTSHHPYVINQVPTRDWQIVEQSHGTITTRKPKDVGVGTGYRDSFFELMNYLATD